MNISKLMLAILAISFVLPAVSFARGCRGGCCGRKCKIARRR